VAPRVLIGMMLDVLAWQAMPAVLCD